MSHDPEISALSNVFEALKGLNRAQIDRIINWVTSKFGIIREKPAGKAEETALAVPVEAFEPVQPAAVVQPVPGPAPESPAAPPVEQAALSGFMKFETVKDFVTAANVKSISLKILLVAAYLQEKEEFQEFSSYDLSTGMKKIGQRVQNISASINNLLNKKPPQLIQVGRMGNSPQARRKYRITEEGLRIAQSYLKD